MEITIPSDEYLMKFQKVVSSFDTEIFNRDEENRALVSIRDSLLPKLMSGELDVDSVQI